MGPEEDAKFEARIYVGEGEDPRTRIDAHHAGKDFWNRLVLFTSVGPNLNKGMIRYLEAALLRRAAGAGRTVLDNGNAPALPPLSEPDRMDAESFLADMLVIYPLLGVNVFESLEQAAGPEKLYLSGPNASGEGSESEEGFVVLAGALARADTAESTPEWAVNMRNGLVQSGVLVPTSDEGSLRLTEEHVFGSPTAAAAVLLGRSASGPIEWRDGSGLTLRQLRERAVAN